MHDNRGISISLSLDAIRNHDNVYLKRKFRTSFETLKRNLYDSVKEKLFSVYDTLWGNFASLNLSSNDRLPKYVSRIELNASCEYKDKYGNPKKDFCFSLLADLSDIDKINPVSFDLYSMDSLFDIIYEDFSPIVPHHKIRNDSININDIDELGGIEFESFLRRVFLADGYKVEKTPATGDSGVDLILDKDGEKVAVQAKRYDKSNTVPNKAVQEIYSGKDIYNCQKAMVITTSYFSKQAIRDAQKLGVELWDRGKLLTKINELNGK